MRINSVLFRYISWSYLKCFLIIIFCFFVITSMIEGMEIVRRFSLISYKIVLKLIVLNSIATISSFFPFTAFLGAILFFMSLHSKMELVIMKVSGLSLKEINRCLILSVMLIGSVYITIFDSVSSFSIEKIKSIENKISLKSDKQSIDDSMILTNSGIWFKDVCEDKSYIIYAKSIENNEFLNVRFFEFDDKTWFRKSISAQKAVIKKGFWNLFETKTINLDNKIITDKIYKIKTDLVLQNIEKMTANPKSISFWNLQKYIGALEKVGLSGSKYKIRWFWQLASILQMIALINLVSVFCFKHNKRNQKNFNVRVFFVLLLAFPIHFINNVFLALGEKNSVPIFMAAFAPPLILICICNILKWQKINRGIF